MSRDPGAGAQQRARIECWLTDMDGVLVHENRAIPGAAELIQHRYGSCDSFLTQNNEDRLRAPGRQGRT